MGYYADEERRGRLRSGLATAIVAEVERRGRMLIEAKSPTSPPDLFEIAMSILDHEEAHWGRLREIILESLANDDEAGEPLRGLDAIRDAYRAIAKELR